MRYTNKEKLEARCYDAALCKTFAGEPANTHGTKEYRVHGCMYLYTGSNEIAMELYSHDPARMEDIVSFILDDRDVHEMVHRYYRKGRRDPYSIEVEEDSSDNKDVYIAFASKAGQGVIYKRRHLLNMCWDGTVHKIERMYIGDFVECICMLQVRGFDFSGKSSYVYTRPYFAVNASTVVHRIAEAPMVSLRDVNRVDITNWSEYDPDRCNNGGGYSYTTIYRRDGDRWSITYSTSVDFEYCPYCGKFGDDCGCTHPEYISTDALVRTIEVHKGNSDFTVELTYNNRSRVEL